MDPDSRQVLLQLHLWDMEEKEADRQHLASYACPCKKCMGAKVLLRKTIRKHLREYGRDPEFKKSILVCMVDSTDTFVIFGDYVHGMLFSSLRYCKLRSWKRGDPMYIPQPLLLCTP